MHVCLQIVMHISTRCVKVKSLCMSITIILASLHSKPNQTRNEKKRKVQLLVVRLDCISTVGFSFFLFAPVDQQSRRCLCACAYAYVYVLVRRVACSMLTTQMCEVLLWSLCHFVCFLCEGQVQHYRVGKQCTEIIGNCIREREGEKMNGNLCHV